MTLSYWCIYKIAGRMANRIKSDQMPRTAGLICAYTTYLGLSVRIFRINTTYRLLHILCSLSLSRSVLQQESYALLSLFNNFTSTWKHVVVLLIGFLSHNHWIIWTAVQNNCKSRSIRKRTLVASDKPSTPPPSENSEMQLRLCIRAVYPESSLDLLI